MSPLRTNAIPCIKCGDATLNHKFCNACAGRENPNINIERILNPTTSHLTVYEDCPNDPRIDF